ncbi:MAG: PilZ domain-containing protein [Candidatus Eremiobacteraeota bacterium]|nr:PilZ domain-containing protein [Candidatus Eremiobacteraeota bacterium]
MFEFLKDMLGFPRPVKVIGYEEPEVIFESESPLELGVVGVLAEIEGVKIRGQVQVIESGLKEHRGYWLKPDEVLPLLTEVYGVQEKRGETRYPRKLRVLSQRLQNFQGHTLDLSEHGMRLEGRGEFQLGESIPITFDLDDSRQTRVTAEAEVRWIGPTVKDGLHAMGLLYTNFDYQQQPEDYGYYRDFLSLIGHEEWKTAT